MNSPLLSIFLAVSGVSLISLAGILFFFFQERILRKILFFLVSLSVGALFGGAFFHLLPEAFKDGGSLFVSGAILAGIFTFFVLEKFFRWKHCHLDSEEEEHRAHPVGPLILLADALHNFLDGIIIASAFLLSPEAGYAATLAVLLHEIPQEIGDFSLLLHAGFSRLRALFWNFFSSLSAFAGAFFALTLSVFSEGAHLYLVPFAAGSFIYIAGSDLVPELHRHTQISQSLLQFFGIFLGSLLMYGLLFFE